MTDQMEGQHDDLTQNSTSGSSDVKNIQACSSTEKMVRIDSLVALKKRHNSEYLESSGEDSGYSTVGFHSMYADPDLPTDLPGHEVSVQEFPGCIKREIRQLAISDVSQSDTEDSIMETYPIRQPLPSVLFDSDEVVSHLRKYIFDESALTLLSPLRIKERALTRDSLFSRSSEDFDIVDMYNDDSCCQTSGIRSEAFLDAVQIDSESAMRYNINHYVCCSECC